MSLGIYGLKLSNLIPCIVWEIYLGNFKEYIAVVYRSQSQNNNKFEYFWYEPDQILSKTFLTNSLFTTILDGFNARSWSWQFGKVPICNQLHPCTTFISLYQVSHIYCLISIPELIFTDKPNLGVNCGAYFPLNCKRLHIVNLF